MILSKPNYCLVIIFLLLVTATQPIYSELQLSNNTITRGETLEIFADLGEFEKKQTVRLKIIDVKNNTVFDKPETGSIGRLSYSYDTGNLDHGNYTAMITHNGTSIFAPFVVRDDDSTKIGTNIVLLLEKRIFNYNEQIPIHGIIKNTEENQGNIFLKITDPANRTIHAQNITVNNGSFNATIPPDDTKNWSKIGYYGIKLTHFNHTIVDKFRIDNETRVVENNKVIPNSSINFGVEFYNDGPLIIHGNVAPHWAHNLLNLVVVDDKGFELYSKNDVSSSNGKFRHIIPQYIVSQWGFGEFDIYVSNGNYANSTAVKISDYENSSTTYNQEYTEEIENLREENNALKNQISQLKNEIENLNSIIMKQILVMIRTLNIRI